MAGRVGRDALAASRARGKGLQIAAVLGISIKTVELHRKRVMEKLGATSATHLMKMVVSERVA